MKIKIKLPIAVTTGSHDGIGAEVISKGLFLLRKKLRPDRFVIFGSPEAYRPFKKFLPSKWALWTEKDFADPKWQINPQALNFIVPYTNHISESIRFAYVSSKSIELAALACLCHRFSAMVTGPIDKNDLHAGGFRFDGHTEMLQSLCKAPSITMMLANPNMKISLVTTHLALKDVSHNLTVDKIVTTLKNTITALNKNFKITRPRIAVLGLNPHASDQGLFGSEESKIIEPSIVAARSLFNRVKIEGPFAADGFFANWNKVNSKLYDAVICMYHDQGLIPIKLLDFEHTVNISLGLPIIRTSVDHGTGKDIVGKNKADATSFCSALKLAQLLVSRSK